MTRLWRYVRAEEAPHVTAHPGSRACRFFDASKEVAFLHRMIRRAVEDEIPRELAWLSSYDKAFAQRLPSGKFDTRDAVVHRKGGQRVVSTSPNEPLLRTYSSKQGVKKDETHRFGWVRLLTMRLL